VTNLTTLDKLHQHIAVLANVKESDSPFFSFYLNVGHEDGQWRQVLDERATTLRRILKGSHLSDFEESLEKVDLWLDTELLPNADSVAIFARGSGGGQFMLPMQFAAPLPNMVAVYPTPNIYHLVELKDNYHRYVVLLTLPDRASIFEVNLGVATTRAWLEYPELRERVGSEWSRSHYQVHQAHRGDRYLEEKLAILDKLMRAGGETHLILAGDPQMTDKVLQELPVELQKKVIDRVPASQRDQQSDVVLATLSSFVEHEEQESQAIADALVEGVRHQNLAVAGTAATLAALQWGEVDTLVMESAYQPDPGWTCTACNALGTATPENPVCKKCDSSAVRPLDVKEALLRLAGKTDCSVEVVEHSTALQTLGGVGCLLRHSPDVDSRNDSVVVDRADRV